MASYDYDKQFEPAQLTTSAATYYTAAGTLRDGRLLLANTTGGAVTYTVYVVPSGGSAGDSNAIVKGKSLGANDFVEIDLPRMKSGDFVQALASAGTSITIHYLGGVEYAA